MILFSASRLREGLERVRAWRAVLTRWVGSWRKCFAVVVLVSTSIRKP
jgi:hypothetical protein